MTRDPRAYAFYKICETIKAGEIEVVDPKGRRRTFGEGAPKGELHIDDWRFVRAVLQRGDIGLGESYSDGWWNSPDLEALIEVILANDNALSRIAAGSFWSRLGFLLNNRFLRRNSRTGSRKNIRAHYDVGNEFYSIWLDDTMTYSSAIFKNEDDPIVDAQHQKYDRLLSYAPGERVLEIGCGWGGLAERAADQGRDVTAITVSDAQHNFALKRLNGRADIRLQDYRDVNGKFDSIISIEMVEAVGEKYWPTYFSTLKQRLADGGRAAIQAIIVEDDAFERYRNRSDYIRQYTFPGGMLLSPNVIRDQAARAGLSAGEVFRFGPDYAKTLRYWRSRFDENEEKIRALGYGDSFIRSWRYYLNICAAAFAGERRTNVIQVELKHA
ncbi:MAG: class I SAM-dependent methyltransferase [Marinicaulis sp.]|nr:cyclopropane-fatty-acyl-phospholipid synthase family protein [Marinicaulis sp.]NNE41507.1 class I SAM-dependent methyltransferase [Marinicaulis sp.]NNL89670.1 class I SAM-dependent methyltransferase [Marinicaulis sp.]